MKIDLKKLNASAHASIPFDETIDLTDEKLYGAKPFQSPVHIKGVVSNESGVVRLAGSIETIYSTECTLPETARDSALSRGRYDALG